jgi:hypothetical protein
MDPPPKKKMSGESRLGWVNIWQLSSPKSEKARL